MFAKPVAEHTSKGVILSSKIKRPENLEKTISQLGALYHGQDILLETFLSGRVITVGILGTGEDSRVIGAVMKSELGPTELTKTVEIYCHPRYRGTSPLASDNPIRQSYAIREKLHTRRSRRNEGHTKECYVSEAIQLDKDCSPPVSPFRPVCPAEK